MFSRMPNRVFDELLLQGKGAHANPVACVEDVSTQMAGKRINGFAHSIWQLVNHMNYWMDYDLKRIDDAAPPYPEHAAQSWPQEALPPSDKHWSDAKAQFSALLQKASALASSPVEVLTREIKPTHPGHTKIASSLQAVLWQLVAHNSYHIGQIALIRSCLGIWPPRAGGDTW
jgi:uncharacterized damage-inducible protein DinB